MPTETEYYNGGYGDALQDCIKDLDFWLNDEGLIQDDIRFFINLKEKWEKKRDELA